jgi:hypothetical protein
MTWVRSNIKRASWVALLAMMIQFALSFGHFHAIASAAPSAYESGSALSKASLAGSLSAEVANIQSGRQPAPNDSDKHSDDICAICTVMAMANAVSFAVPPALPLPQIGKFSRLNAKSEFARVASTFVAFQPRAPPIS